MTDQSDKSDSFSNQERFAAAMPRQQDLETATSFAPLPSVEGNSSSSNSSSIHTSSITANGSSSSRKKTKRRGVTTSSSRSKKRVSHYFLCRLGVRHWFRVASTAQKCELFLAFFCSVLGVLSFFGMLKLPTAAITRIKSVEPKTTTTVTSAAKVQKETSEGDILSSKEPEGIAPSESSHSSTSFLSMAGEALKKTEHFLEEELKGVRQPHMGFEDMNFFGPSYDHRTDLSPEEWTKMRKLISSFPAGAKIAIAWPTIPVPYKGSDSRAVDAIRTLSEAGFAVDLIFWRDFASEIHSDAHDDTPERQRVMEAGVNRILGPYEDTPLSRSHTFVSSYHAMVFWLWPHIEWLDALTDMITHVSSMNGTTKLIAAVDDAGVSARLLQGAFAQSDNPVSMEQVFEYMYYSRPQYLLGGQDLQKTLMGSSASSSSLFLLDGGTNAGNQKKPTKFDNDKWNYAKVLLQQEMYIYTRSDVLVGINDATLQFFEKMVPTVPALKLSYVSPVQPLMQGTYLAKSKSFSERSGYLFFGYNNFANNEGMSWFGTNVLSNIPNDHKLHIAGKVYVPSLCSCRNYDTAVGCTSRHKNVICHGALSDEELDELISSTLVSINPVMEPSGVATKTCRAMAHGTPVVVTDQDGTFSSTNMSIGGKRCKLDDSRSTDGSSSTASCFVKHLTDLLEDESKWKEASQAAPSFIAEHYGAGKYKRDWLSIIETVTKTPSYEVLLIGNADFHGESLASQNWHLANMMQKDIGDLVKVTVLADKLDPPIPNVKHVVWNDLTSSPLETGYQADLVIRQNWPPDFSSLPFSICGTGCRVANILPWEFGSLPNLWMEQIKRNVDFLWAPSEYNRLIYERSGFPSDSTSVAPAGVDCKTLLDSSTKSKANEGNGGTSDTSAVPKDEDEVRFLFTGGFIPRKGTDILVEEWYDVFCDPNGHQKDLFEAYSPPKHAKLIIQTSYELGFTKHEAREFQKTIESCNGKIEWKRGWMSRDQYLSMMNEADIYVAPFRSEGFGIPIVESLILGKAAIASVGGTAADDYMISTSGMTSSSSLEHLVEKQLYPVHADGAKCEKDPCRGQKLCVFPPCAYGSCTCGQLVNGPTWFEVNRDDLRKQMAQAYKDVASKKSMRSILSDPSVVAGSDNNAKSFCWDELSNTYRNLINNAIKSPIRRTPQQFTRPVHQPTNPIVKFLSKHEEIWVLSTILLVFVFVRYFWNGHGNNTTMKEWIPRRVLSSPKYKSLSTKEK